MNTLSRGIALAAALAVTSMVAGYAQAKPIAYPAKGQSPQVQAKDDGECYAWAKGNTGVDPAAMAAAPAPQPSGPTGQVARGAIGGAVVGGIISGGEGARTGAAVGGAVGVARAARRQQAQAAQAQQAQAQKQGAMDTYYRAYSACMTGRGYTIQ